MPGHYDSGLSGENFKIVSAHDVGNLTSLAGTTTINLAAGYIYNIEIVTLGHPGTVTHPMRPHS